MTYHSTGGAVTPGAAGDEVRVDCCLMNEDGKTVVTGSTLGPPQVWNMQVKVNFNLFGNKTLCMKKKRIL